MRILREAGPDLLAIDHPFVTALHRSGGQRGQVTARARLGESLAPLLFAGQQLRHHLGGEFFGRVVDHGRRQHFEHRIRAGFDKPAAHHFLADDGPEHRRTAESAGVLRPAVAAPAAVVERLLHAGELAHVAFQRMVIRRCQVILGEPILQRRAEGRRFEQVAHAVASHARLPHFRSANRSLRSLIRLPACRSRAAGRGRGHHCAG